MTGKPRGIGDVAGHVRRDGGPKVGYATREEARAVATQRQNPYRCGLCGLWHVGAKR